MNPKVVLQIFLKTEMTIDCFVLEDGMLDTILSCCRFLSHLLTAFKSPKWLNTLIQKLIKSFAKEVINTCEEAW